MHGADDEQPSRIAAALATAVDTAHQINASVLNGVQARRAVTTHHAPCTLHHAPCTMHHAPCTMHYAPCTAPRTTHHAPHHTTDEPNPNPNPSPSQASCTVVLGVPNVPPLSPPQLLDGSQLLVGGERWASRLTLTLTLDPNPNPEE
tara:strand:- start:1063 stop:1503 length:441 start_codon:yes stop_codon:yes gene_type:complete